MSDPLAWTGAIGGAVAAVGAVIAAIGAWRTEATARWQARVERLRNDQARKENELHRMRHKQLYDWWHDMPDGPARIRAMRWFGEWTGARNPYHGSDQGAIPPGFGCSDADMAYDRYIALLDAVFHPGRLGPPPRSLEAPDKIRMPLVVGLNVSQARAVISSDFADAQVTTQYSDAGTAPAGMVTSQQPDPGSEVAPDVRIQLTVSTEPAPEDDLPSSEP